MARAPRPFLARSLVFSRGARARAPESLAHARTSFTPAAAVYYRGFSHDLAGARAGLVRRAKDQRGEEARHSHVRYYIRDVGIYIGGARFRGFGEVCWGLGFFGER